MKKLNPHYMKHLKMIMKPYKIFGIQTKQSLQKPVILYKVVQRVQVGPKKLALFISDQLL